MTKQYFKLKKKSGDPNQDMNMTVDGLQCIGPENGMNEEHMSCFMNADPAIQGDITKFTHELSAGLSKRERLTNINLESQAANISVSGDRDFNALNSGPFAAAIDPEQVLPAPDPAPVCGEAAASQPVVHVTGPGYPVTGFVNSVTGLLTPSRFSDFTAAGFLPIDAELPMLDDNS